MHFNTYYLLILTLLSLFKKTIESETAKTSEVLKKKLGNLSETVKEVNMIGPSLRCSLSFDYHDRYAVKLIHPPLGNVFMSCLCVNRG